MQFTTVEAEAGIKSGVKMLVYAGAGYGKTVLCSTLGPGTLMISAEAGLLSLRRSNLDRIFGANSPNIAYDMPVVKIENGADFYNVLSWLYTSPQAARFHTICLDSLTEIAEVILNAEKKVAKDPRQAYGALVERMEPMIKSYRDLPGKNVIMTSKMDQTKDELTGYMQWAPTMPGKMMGPKLPYLFDEVFYLGTAKSPEGKDFRYLLTQPTQQFVAKDRSGALAMYEQPHLSIVMSKILGA